MTELRPKNLNLFTIHFPIPAIVSILHRISGVALLVVLPGLMWLFAYSLTSSGFDHIKAYLAWPLLKVFTWLILLPLCFHLIAGLRHLLMDMHIGDSLAGGRLTSILTFVITFILMLSLGIWLW